jgi:heterodisulfide reductase subunit A-like polyferredoxin
LSSFNSSISQNRNNNKNSWEKKTSGSKEPSWYSNIEQPIKFAKMANNIPSSAGVEPVDVVIIGGGIAGLTTAYPVVKV